MIFDNTRRGIEPATGADDQEEKRDLAERDSPEPRRNGRRRDRRSPRRAIPPRRAIVLFTVGH